MPLSPLLQKAPELERLRKFQLRCRRDAQAEFSRRCRGFASEWTRGGDSIKTIIAGRSDFHDQNRTVVEVRLRSGKKWFYKPRSGRFEAAWNAFLRQLAQIDFPLRFKVMRIECRGAYFWMEGAPSHQPRSRRQSAEFYFRSGALLYLLHVLRAVDCHRDNFLRCGAHPVLVDCEALLHRRPRCQRLDEDEAPLIGTGLLPRAGWPAAANVSALGACVKGESLLPLVEIAQQLGSGFESMHRSLASKPGQCAFRRLVTTLQSGRSRQIIRPTAHYFAILHDSLSSHFLQERTARSTFLRARCRVEAASERGARREASALRNLDIPRFYSRPAAPRPPLSSAEMSAALAVIERAFASFSWGAGGGPPIRS